MFANNDRKSLRIKYGISLHATKMYKYHVIPLEQIVIYELSYNVVTRSAHTTVALSPHRHIGTDTVHLT